MKKNNIRFAVMATFVALFAFTSCQKEQQKEEIVFTASIDNEGAQSKTTFNNSTMTWNSGDQVRVLEFSASPYGNDEFYYYFADFRTSQSGATAGFSYLNNGNTLPMNEEDEAYLCIHPASMATAWYQITLPAERTWDGSRLDAPIYALNYWNLEGLRFKNLCGVLAIHVTANKSISSIEVTADRPLSGRFDFTMNADPETGDYTIPSLTPATNNTGNTTITLNCGDGVDCNNGQDFYIYLPPATYSQMTITINTTDGYPIVKTLNSAFTVARSKYYTLNVDYSGV